MRTAMIVMALAGLSAVSLAAALGPVAEDLKVGDSAPAFSLAGSDGKMHTLAEFKGKKVVVLAWFPKAFTSG